MILARQVGYFRWVTTSEVFARHPDLEISLTLFIPCTLIQLNRSFVTSTNARLIYINTVLYRSYIFRRHLYHPRGLPIRFIVNDDQQDATFWFIYLFLISSTCFGRCFRPSSGAFDCIYSFWYCPLMLLPAGVMDAIPSHP